MRPLSPGSSALLLLLALAAPGCKGGCDQAGAGGATSGPGGDASSLGVPSSPRFGGSNCPGGSCSAAGQSVALPAPGQGQDQSAVRSLPAFSDRRVADASAQPAPAPVAGRAVVPPVQGREQPRQGPPPPAHSGVKELRTQAELDAALASGTPMVVKWYGPQCGPCRVLAPAYEDAARELDGQVAFYSVNSHGEGAPNIPQIQSLPGLAYYEGGRLLTHRNGLPAGVRAREVLKSWLIGALANRSL